MAMIDTAYSYYMTTYGHDVATRYDTHKKSELRSVYNNILKLNKEAPLFKIDDPDQAQRFAIDIKEASKDIQHVVSTMSTKDSLDKAFSKKVAISSNTDIAEATYIGDEDADGKAMPFTIEVDKLAAPQINTGHYVPSGQVSMAPGEYSFDLDTNSTSYEFQFTVHAGDTNRNILDRLTRLINQADLNLTAQVIEDGQGRSALEITSKHTGLMNSEEYLFKISDDNTYNSKQAVQFFGLDQVSQEASNSRFYLNGEEHSSYSNNFTINRMFELHLKSPSENGEYASIGFKADADAIADNIGRLTDAYNELAGVAKEHSGSSAQMNKLYNIISNISNRYRNDFDPIGLTVNEDATISIDKALLADATESSDWQENFDRIFDFKNTVSSLANHTSLNPMEYVDKTVVAYKNPGRNLTAPYASSTYAGMLYDFAC